MVTVSPLTSISSRPSTTATTSLQSWCVTVATDHAPYMDQIRASMQSAGFRLERETATVPALDRSLFAERFERLGAPVLYQRWLRA